MKSRRIAVHINGWLMKTASVLKFLLKNLYDYVNKKAGIICLFKHFSINVRAHEGTCFCKLLIKARLAQRSLSIYITQI